MGGSYGESVVQGSLCEVTECAASQRPAPLAPSIFPQRGETALDFAKYNTNKGESIPLLDKVGCAALYHSNDGEEN